ncbi:MAG: hypothetical protein BJ554DRAFT_6252 [Olpidium bornovanus]|uniref:Uncharacterized protein n=1 Tax=Olpidium bornovanus TaxID=278681 RepID=A0A8H7ZY49_9FUNG|nr:MAG: hypothetical protein BJ554DRAFT_6252 [Olpidium bornovanus]
MASAPPASPAGTATRGSHLPSPLGGIYPTRNAGGSSLPRFLCRPADTFASLQSSAPATSVEAAVVQPPTFIAGAAAVDIWQRGSRGA